MRGPAPSRRYLMRLLRRGALWGYGPFPKGSFKLQTELLFGGRKLDLIYRNIRANDHKPITPAVYLGGVFVLSDHYYGIILMENVKGTPLSYVSPFWLSEERRASLPLNHPSIDEVG